MDKGNILILGITVVVLLVIGGLAFSNDKKNASAAPRDKCIQHEGLGMHIHPVLQIQIEDQAVAIPANIGITAGCMKAVHTHDETGKIHLEYPEVHDFVLGDFFAVWGQPFSKTQIMDKIVDDTHTLTVEVDGQPNQDFENLILKDNQQIMVKYQKK